MANEHSPASWSVSDPASRGSAPPRADRSPPASELRWAIEGEELVPYFEPKVEVATGRLVGAEALVRWEHPTRGLLAPSEFLPAMAERGLMAALTLRVLQAALDETEAWHRAGHELTVAVNTPAESLFEPRFPTDVERLIKERDLPPGFLTLEITEDVLMGDFSRALGCLQRLCDVGVELAIDDFGTGYSSLSRLSRLPIEEVKIDRSFISAIGESEGDRQVVRMIADLGRYLGKRVVAEGVESEDQLATLQVLACDQAQGHLFSPPLSGPAFGDWIAQRPPRPARALAPPASTETGGVAVSAQETPPVGPGEVEAVLDGALDAFVSVDGRGLIVGWNRRAEEMFGWPRREVLGRRLAPLIIPSRFWEAHEQGFKRFLQTGEGRLVGKRVEMTATNRDGREFPVEIALSSVRAGGRLRVNAFLHDISERRRAEQRAAVQRAVAEVLAVAPDLASAGRKLVTAIGAELQWDLVQLWRVVDGALAPAEAWCRPDVEAQELLDEGRRSPLPAKRGLPGRVFASAEPEWLEEVLKERGFLRRRGAAAAGLYTAVAVPLGRPGQVMGVLELFSRPIRPRDDDLLRTLAGVGEMIAQYLRRCEAQEELRRDREEVAPVSAIVAELLGNGDRVEGRRNGVRSDPRLLGASSAILLEPDSLSEWLEPTAASGIDLPEFQIPIEGKGNAASRALCSGERVLSPTAAEDGDVPRPLVEATGAGSVLFEPVLHGEGALGVLVLAWREPLAALPLETARRVGVLAEELAVAIERADLLERLERASNIDDLTGLPDRRTFEAVVRRELDRANGRRLAPSLAMLELDPTLADAGEGGTLHALSLKACAAAWSSVLRRGDVLARIGGTRFGLLLSDSSRSATQSAVGRMRAVYQPERAAVVEHEPEESAERLLARLESRVASEEGALL